MVTMVAMVTMVTLPIDVSLNTASSAEMIVLDL